ncbi:MAG: ribose ABC transporter [Streptomycetaceae bacterium]|nr:MAG: ribose ABC transporter [Streptomycetaceae bacterium]
MLRNGVINGQLASVLARFRHVNTLAIVDGPFPSYPGVELVDLALIKGFPSIPDVLDAILPLMELTGLYLANEFSEKVDSLTVEKYKKYHGGVPTILIPHEEFKIKVGQAIAIIHTGDAVPYSSVILKSG